MKKFLIFLCLMCVFISPSNSAVQIKVSGGADDGLNFLRNEIRKLEKELNTKTKMLNKCATQNKNFQIAGIATVGLTVAGVATNISLYNKMKDQQKTAKNMMNKILEANIQGKELVKEVERLSDNLDDDMFLMNLDKSLTDAEKQRFIELHEVINRGGHIQDSEFSESDEVMFGKIIRAMRESQK